MSRRADRERLVIVGNGMASVRLCEELVAAGGHHRFSITVLGAEAVAGYNRVLLSAHLAGEATDEDIRLRDVAWYASHGIDLRLGTRVTSIDPGKRMISLADGETLGFDRLVLATGSEPIRLPIPGAHLSGVHMFRDLDDARALAGLGTEPKRIAVIGGGLLGLEAAYGLSRAGHQVTIIHLMQRLMERQLDARAAGHLGRAIQRKGIAIRLGIQTQAILGDSRVSALTFTDGSILEADAVVFSAGIRPNVALATSAGLPVQRGILVDDSLACADGIHALGECAEHRGTVYGLVEPAYAQARVLARILCGEEASYEGSVLATNLKVSGVSVFSVGDIEGAPGTESATFEDRSRGEYRKLVFRDSRLVGAVLVGDTREGLWYRDLVSRGDDIATLRADLIFGQSVCAPLMRDAA